MKRLGGRRHAFTMIEIMVAAVILAVGIVIIYESLLKSLDAYRVFETGLQAQWVAQEIMTGMEGRIRDPWSAPFIGRQEGARSFDTRVFTWQAQVLPQADMPDLYQVSVTVTWPDGNRTRRVERTTLLSVPQTEEEQGA